MTTNCHESRVDLFFELIQVALGSRECLSRNPTDEDWQKLYDMCQMQAVAGVVFAALDGLSKFGQKPPLDILIDWIGLSEDIKQQNREVNRNTVKLCEELEKDGFLCCILKGQGNVMMYPDSLTRTPGDIDVWSLTPNPSPKGEGNDVRHLVEYVRKKNPEGNACYHHIDYGVYHGTEVEVHYRPSFMFNPVHNRRLQKWFSEMADGGCLMVDLPEGAGLIRVPNRKFNIIFQLSHVYNHLLHEGIGLKQVMDYYYLLKSNTNNSDNTDISRILETYGTSDQGRARELENQSIIGPVKWGLTESTKITEKTLRYLGMEKIAGAMMWVLSEKLGLEEEYLIAPKDEKRGKVLLKEIMRGGNLGLYDAENLKANSRIKKGIQRFRRDLRMMRYFPSESLWEPIFRTYHFFWRMKYN